MRSLTILALSMGTLMPLHATAAAAADNTTATCKCIPGDSCWPTVEEWDAFNATIGGRLVVPRPLATVCHNPSYDQSACEYMRREWTSPWLHDDDDSSIMAPALSGGACHPFSARELPCEPGNAITYSVNATDYTDFVKAIAFARSRNIRLVIRNTGHDFLGKSTGKWALSVWTHHMKGAQYLQWNSTAYNGPAMRLRAGVQVEEAYEAADAHNAMVVGGDCATVGVVGGFLQGGGHSPLSSIYGLGSDQVLEWEVVDGRGRLLKASPQENSDLYWALSGGGGGTYGIVTSVVVRVYPSTRVTGVQLAFDLDVERPEAFYGAVAKYHEQIIRFSAAGGMGIAAISDTSFSLTPLALPNMSRADAEALIAPLVQELSNLDVRYSLNVTELPSFLTFWRQLIRPNPTQLVQNAQHGGWMVPRSVIEDNASGLESALREITDAGCSFVGLALNASLPDGSSAVEKNSILPSWRTAAMAVILTTSWPEGADERLMRDMRNKMTEKCVPALAKLAPEAGAYLNEADPDQPDWQTAFYGENYDRLVAIKNKYDPHHVFYAHTAVGSDSYWINDEGRLCRR
ncbi:FAD-linked oxidoreductase patO [Paramyrothecium foliicola]|nr:FAD-linked oxidoreductase patO [Paramyrothecium foliicola]